MQIQVGFGAGCGGAQHSHQQRASQTLAMGAATAGSGASQGTGCRVCYEKSPTRMKFKLLKLQNGCSMLLILLFNGLPCLWYLFLLISKLLPFFHVLFAGFLMRSTWAGASGHGAVRKCDQCFVQGQRAAWAQETNRLMGSLKLCFIFYIGMFYFPTYFPTQIVVFSKLFGIFFDLFYFRHIFDKWLQATNLKYQSIGSQKLQALERAVRSSCSEIGCRATL